MVFVFPCRHGEIKITWESASTDQSFTRQTIYLGRWQILVDFDLFL
jgi:hypothetical protein